ncbi:hypothetical protein FQN54_006049 [Arachnomyces sp. PD_36]|nr:hypothetical protein FQN54_006049 [Arachnomyces sp. PD_36]
MASTNLKSPTPSTMTPTWPDFDRRVDEVKTSKTDMNLLVMNYLVTKGYPCTVKNFAAEANIKLDGGADSIEERVEIRNAIHSGDIQSAIEKINELDPQILDENPSLHFSLLRLQLVELIRVYITTPNGDISAPLDFATSQLAPRAPTNPQFLDDLEKTLALLIFPPENLTPSLSCLLDPELRKSVASRVSETILKSQGARGEARLYSLLRARAWAEREARKGGSELPSKMDLGLDWDSNDRRRSSETRNGSGDTIMQGNGELDPMIT